MRDKISPGDASYSMRLDPALCEHKKIRKFARIELITVPELEMGQLVLRIKVSCASCKGVFGFRVQNAGFSTEEPTTLGDELLVPLEPPSTDETDETEGEPLPSEGTSDEVRPPKEPLH
jgi:hypothetical protein